MISVVGSDMTDSSLNYSPGVMETELSESLSEKIKQAFLGMIPGRRFGTTEEVSHAVAFPASWQDRTSMWIGA